LAKLLKLNFSAGRERLVAKDRLIYRLSDKPLKVQSIILISVVGKRDG